MFFRKAVFTPPFGILRAPPNLPIMAYRYPQVEQGLRDRPGLKPQGYIATPHEWGYLVHAGPPKAPFMGRRYVAPSVYGLP